MESLTAVQSHTMRVVPFVFTSAATVGNSFHIFESSDAVLSFSFCLLLQAVIIKVAKTQKKCVLILCSFKIYRKIRYERDLIVKS